MATPDGHSPIDGLPTTAAIHHVGIKLPKFMAFDPELWFLQCDSAFATARITAEATRYHHAVSVLEPEIIRKVRAYIKNPQINSEYSSFKTALLKATLKPQPERVQELVTCVLGDSRPSDLLATMQTIWPDDNSTPSNFLRELFLRKLPAPLQPGLASATSLSLLELAERADTEVASFRLATNNAHSSGIVGLVSAHPSFATEPSEPLDGSEVHPVLATYHHPRRGNRPRPVNRKPLNSTLCFYHQRFGPAAKKCQPGCQFQPPSTGNDRSTRFQ